MMHLSKFSFLAASLAATLPLQAAPTTASWVYQTTSSAQFADGLLSNAASSHTFAADVSGYSMQVSAWTMNGYILETAPTVTLPGLSAAKLAPARDLSEVGVGIYNYGADNEIRNEAGSNSDNWQILQLSNLRGPSGTTISELHLSLNSVDYSSNATVNEGFLVFGSACADMSSCTLTQLAKVKANAAQGKNGYTVDLLGANFTPYTQFWITADNTWTSSIILGNSTSVTSVTAVPEPQSYALMLAGLLSGGLVLARRRANGR